MTRETEKAAFLNRIIEAPDEDTVRLVYADWLEEHGEPQRAEFIRVQIELENAEGNERQRLKVREFTLWHQHAAEWAAEYRGRGVYHLGFRRGFVEEIHATATAFLRRGAAWAERAPLQDVRLTAVAGRATSLASCGHLRAVKGLTVYDEDFDDSDLTVLVGSPNIGGLRTLCVGGRGRTHLRDEREYRAEVSSWGVECLTQADVRPRLTELRVRSHQGIDADAVARVFDGNAFPSLRAVTLSGFLGDEGAAAIASGAIFPRIERLNLNFNGIGEAGAYALLDAGRAERLQVLALDWNALDHPAIVRIAEREFPTQLRVLLLPWVALRAMPRPLIEDLRRRHPQVDLDLDRMKVGMEAALLLADEQAS